MFGLAQGSRGLSRTRSPIRMIEPDVIQVDPLIGLWVHSVGGEGRQGEWGDGQAEQERGKPIILT